MSIGEFTISEATIASTLEFEIVLIAIESNTQNDSPSVVLSLIASPQNTESDVEVDSLEISYQFVLYMTDIESDAEVNSLNVNYVWYVTLSDIEFDTETNTITFVISPYRFNSSNMKKTLRDYTNVGDKQLRGYSTGGLKKTLRG